MGYLPRQIPRYTDFPRTNTSAIGEERKQLGICKKKIPLLSTNQKTAFTYKVALWKNYHNVGTIPKSNIKIVDRFKINTPNTQIHDPSLVWLGTGTSVKSGEVKLALCSHTSHLSEFNPIFFSTIF